MTTVTVAAPQCAPARVVHTRVQRQLATIGTWRGQFAPRIRTSEVKENKRLLYIRVDVDFSNESAAWGEYNLLRWGYDLLSQPVNRKNLVWAARYTTGDLAHGWYEPGCSGKHPAGARVANLAGELPQANPPTPWDAKRRQSKPGWLAWLEDLLG